MEHFAQYLSEEGSLVRKATADEAEPTPGYLYNELVQYAQRSSTSSTLIADLLIKKLQAGMSPHPKYKALQCMKQIMQKGPSDFVGALRPKVESIRLMTTFRGDADPVRGDQYNNLVRENAQIVVDMLFEADSRPKAASSSVSSSSQHTPQANLNADQSSFGTRAASISQSGFSAFKGVVNSIQSTVAATSGFSSIGGNPSSTDRILSGGSTDVASYNVSRSTNDNADNSYGSKYQPRVEAASGAQESKIVDEITAVSGVRTNPTRESLKQFCTRADSLNKKAICQHLSVKLKDSSWQVKLKSLYTIEALLKNDAAAYVPLFKSYSSAINDAQNSSQASVQEKAQKVLALLSSEEQTSGATKAKKSGSKKKSKAQAHEAADDDQDSDESDEDNSSHDAAGTKQSASQKTKTKTKKSDSKAKSASGTSGDLLDFDDFLASPSSTNDAVASTTKVTKQISKEDAPRKKASKSKTATNTDSLIDLMGDFSVSTPSAAPTASMVPQSASTSHSDLDLLLGGGFSSAPPSGVDANLSSLLQPSQPSLPLSPQTMHAATMQQPVYSLGNPMYGAGAMNPTPMMGSGMMGSGMMGSGMMGSGMMGGPMYGAAGLGSNSNAMGGSVYNLGMGGSNPTGGLGMMNSGIYNAGMGSASMGGYGMMGSGVYGGAMNPTPMGASVGGMTMMMGSGMTQPARPHSNSGSNGSVGGVAVMMGSGMAQPARPHSNSGSNGSVGGVSRDRAGSGSKGTNLAGTGLSNVEQRSNPFDLIDPIKNASRK
eukprot:TRINITY_DN1379_c0_g1_i9.p1 TRINITY_DN1379_c0_g1~~TRINITY_DN1379_c0_g1_i9.p1  ORF type:complete len:771 (+),score=183.11 TRINITY_DN1379_c0_g1_i9:58-2370(+)